MELRSLLLALIATAAAFGLARQCRRTGPLELGLPVVALGVAVYLTVVFLVRFLIRQAIPLPASFLASPEPLPPQLAPAESPVRLSRRARRGACTPPPQG